MKPYRKKKTFLELSGLLIEFSKTELQKTENKI